MAPPVIEHRPRDFHSCKNHPLSGITFPQWVRLLREHGDAIEVFRFFPRLAFLSCMSVVNSVGSVADSLLYGRAIARQELNPEVRLPPTRVVVKAACIAMTCVNVREGRTTCCFPIKSTFAQHLKKMYMTMLSSRILSLLQPHHTPNTRASLTPPLIVPA